MTGLRKSALTQGRKVNAGADRASGRWFNQERKREGKRDGKRREREREGGERETPEGKEGATSGEG